jgi:hexokinase
MKDKALQKFLSGNCLDISEIDIDSECNRYISEMRRKLSDPENQKELLPSYISNNPLLEPGKKVAVMDAGGTNLRAALVAMNDGFSIEVEKQQNIPMPGSHGKVTSEYFFDKAALLMKCLLNETDYLSICFSYPLAMTSRYAGSVIQLAKQLEIEAIAGAEIISEFKKSFLSAGSNIPSKITILNDSVAVLLGGTAYSLLKYDGYAALILGTGVNMAYVENCENIQGISNDYSHTTMILNVEASRYNLMPKGKTDRLMDNNTVDPGDYQFEKMLSGKYLGPLFLYILRDAVESNLFSKELEGEIYGITAIETHDITGFFYRPDDENVLRHLCNRMSANDKKVFDTLLDALLDRAALYCAVAVSAVVIKSIDKRNHHKYGIIIEGGTIRNLRVLFDKMEKYLSLYLGKQKGVAYEFIFMENATLIGSAAAAFCC